jgi:hypothetical protein
LLATASAEGVPAISPDAHWLAYTSNDSGTFEVYLQRFPQGGDRVPVSIGGGAIALWSAGGRALSYLAIRGNVPTSMVRATVGPGTVPTLGSPMDLFPWRYHFVGDGRSHVDMTADGERFLVISDNARSTGGGDQLVLVQNWSEELKGLASAKR